MNAGNGGCTKVEAAAPLGFAATARDHALSCQLPCSVTVLLRRTNAAVITLTGTTAVSMLASQTKSMSALRRIHKAEWVFMSRLTLFGASALLD